MSGLLPRTALCAGLLVAASSANALTLWSTDQTFGGGAGQFFGPGTWTQPEPLFPVIIRNMGFQSDSDFQTPFRNHGGLGPKTMGETELGLTDGKLTDGALINENVDTGTFTIAGTNMFPAVVRSDDGKFGGSQAAVSVRDGQVVMVMDLTLDLGIGPRGVIKMPFYGTTGSVTVPLSLQTQNGGKGVDMAGQIASGTTIAGRVGDVKRDGYIGGTLVASGVMPLTSPIYPGQPWAMVRNFETDIAAEGRILGSIQDSIAPAKQSAK